MREEVQTRYLMTIISFRKSKQYSYFLIRVFNNIENCTRNIQYSKFSTDDSTAMPISYVHLHCNQRNSIEFILNSTDFHRPFSNSIQEQLFLPFFQPLEPFLFLIHLLIFYYRVFHTRYCLFKFCIFVGDQTRAENIE